MSMHSRAERAIDAFRAASAAQPAPRAAEGEPVWRRVLADLFELHDHEEPCVVRVLEGLSVERSDLGFRRYGTLLRAGNGRNFLVDYLEERLDGIAYLRGELMRLAIATNEVPAELAELYRDELRITGRAVRLWVARVDAGAQQ